MEIRQDKSVLWRGRTQRALLFLADIIVVNFSYYISVIIRFTDKTSFRDSGIIFMQRFKAFTLWYTIACIVIFLLFHLYSGVWRYAGFNDFKKLIMANVCTCIFYVFGSLLIVGRMPISVYFLGAVFQFILMCISRLAPRYIYESVERARTGDSDGISVPLMIVGIGENTRIIQNKIARDRTNIVKPVCVVDSSYGYKGNTFNGLPVFSGKDAIGQCIDKFGVRCVIIAEDNMPEEFTETVRYICKERNIELRDFVIGTEYRVRGVGLKGLLCSVEGKVCIICKGMDDRHFVDGRSAMHSIDGNWVVEEISAKGDEIIICVSAYSDKLAISNEEWIMKYREETGSDISFF